MTSRPEDASIEDVEPRYRPYTAKAAEPWEEFAHDRARCPVARNAELGAVQVTTYEGVKELLGEHRTFSNASGNIWPLKEPLPPEEQVLGWADPPRHTRQRKLLVKALSASRIQNMRAFSERLADDIIDDLSERGSFEMYEDFAERMAAGHVCELLGIPESERDEYARAAKRMEELVTVTMDGRAEGGYGTELNEWLEHLGGMIRAKRAAGPDSDDLITQLSFARVDGDYFEVGEIARVIQLLNVAGIGTTIGAIGNTAYLLDRYPEQKARFLSDVEGLAPSLAAESLRFETPISGLWRTCAKPTRIGNIDVEPGEKAFAVISAANHDPQVFDRPDEFIIERDWANLPTDLPFGQGIHFCVGMNMARLEIQVATAKLYKRLPNLRVRPGFEPELLPGAVLRRFETLEMIFDTPVLPRTT
ncbi:cytochrome P450 [Streptomyces ipomoeae]|uniref:Unspecific monooxygenase n=2 Tax=Streptomyces ipomoeae TaxID=103232 RepID=L1KPR9_9ACTN|nr:cytochrome P450 [Streptomyces ipomoeae]EKX62490.1 unspecific monooxygenase [Streptomyces ipomoeae 91-03]MDX2694331.1 cytochrome P450 [Streptomyces ipomoeae]MDX2819829.1 cytochrome P450 [Streptomyces ipomoeae]MDX2837745.1 cytochrome P450 [Streptomyces ipomoeae]MDX2872235.1 cytochrome P450 [Streptomyces ipomoeae]